jgi:hypothetical protein
MTAWAGPGPFLRLKQWSGFGAGKAAIENQAICPIDLLKEAWLLVYSVIKLGFKNAIG